MGIYKLTPACKDYLWGGHKLVEKYNIHYEGEICAEAWTLSCHKDGPSVITDSDGTEYLLPDFIKMKGKDILGTNCTKYGEFPILIKLIDAKKPLSIQVHPDDEYALIHEKQYGKTEMWYVLEADEGAFLYEGFKKEISKDEFEKRIKNNTLTEVLNKVEVKKGDVIFISPGTLHAIGAGIVVAEIQQNSNVTYRIYDYGRVGADGKTRPLHIQQSLDVTRLEPPKPYISDGTHMVISRFFCVDHVEVKGSTTDTCNDDTVVGTGGTAYTANGYATGVYTDNAGSDSFVNLLITGGEGIVSLEEKSINSEVEGISVRKGDSVLITAGTGKYHVKGNLEFIKTIVP